MVSLIISNTVSRFMVEANQLTKVVKTWEMKTSDCYGSELFFLPVVTGCDSHSAKAKHNPSTTGVPHIMKSV